MAQIEISNMPQDVDEKYIVFRVSSGAAWYWGAFDIMERAIEVARQVDGAVAENDRNCEH